MSSVSSARNLWNRIFKKSNPPDELVLDPKYFEDIPTFDEMFAKIVKELVFGENAMEDFHASTALMEGIDEYGRIFFDFDEERRLHVINCYIRQACKNVEERNTKKEL